MRVWALSTVFIATATASRYDGWQPHAYCNDLEGIADKAITPLTPDQEQRVESLEQVQLIARHGARAPFTKLRCWDSNTNPMLATWNCSTSSVSSQDIGNTSEKGFGRLYKKSYLDGENILNGDCIVGGLLDIGRQQHLRNGEHLRKAYIGEGPLKLFSDESPPVDSIYLRSDDEERTVGSGHALMDGFFPPDGSSLSRSLDDKLTWHVADYATDHINANGNICPILPYIGGVAKSSDDFQAHIHSKEVLDMQNKFEKGAGNFEWGTMLECLSVSRCNGLPLPGQVDDSLFQSLIEEAEWRESMQLLYNDSWFSNIGMQPLANEIRGRMEAMANGEAAPKLAITMGHDSTIMPFLAASLRHHWDRKWTPYAGVLNIELYKLMNGKHAARMIFLGKPLLVPECQDTLCELDTFLRAFDFAKKPRTDEECASPVPPQESAGTKSNDDKGMQSTMQYVSAAAVTAVIAVCAFAAVHFYRRNYNGNDQPVQESNTLLGA